MATSDFQNPIVYPQGRHVRAARRELQLSLEVVARDLGKGDGSFLSRVERGEYAPNLELKLQLVERLSAGGLTLEQVAQDSSEVSLVKRAASP